jgi:hypothetical protein
MPSDDVRADMDKIRAFYAGKTARHADQAGEVRLREEAENRLHETEESIARSDSGGSDADPALDG